MGLGMIDGYVFNTDKDFLAKQLEGNGGTPEDVRDTYEEENRVPYKIVTKDVTIKNEVKTPAGKTEYVETKVTLTSYAKDLTPQGWAGFCQRHPQFLQCLPEK